MRGRDFTDADTLDRPRVAIVNESFARRFGLGDDPVGKRIGFDELRGARRRDRGARSRRRLRRRQGRVSPLRSSCRAGSRRNYGNGATFYVRGELPPESLLAAVPRIVARVDSSLPVMEPRTLDSQVRRNVRTDWLLVTLAGALAGVATLLAALGLYGVLSYMVAQRTREIGLRLALGARAGARAAHGAEAGRLDGRRRRAGRASARRCLSAISPASMLFGLAPTDPRAVIAAVALLAVAVFGASYWPARRASRVDPVVALRAE